MFLTTLTLTRFPISAVIRAFDAADAADVEADGGVEFQRAAACCCFRAAVHDADFFADLVDEDGAGIAFGKGGSEFSQGLRHHARLQAHERVADLPFQLRFRHEGGHGVDDDDIDGIGAGEHFCDVERFFAAVRLRNQQVVDVDADFGCIGGSRACSASI